MLAVILTLLIGTLCGIDLYLKSYIETHYKEGEEKKILGDTISVRKVHNKGMALNKGEEHPKRVRMLSGIVTALLVLYYVFLFRKKGGLDAQVCLQNISENKPAWGAELPATYNGDKSRFEPIECPHSY